MQVQLRPGPFVLRSFVHACHRLASTDSTADLSAPNQLGEKMPEQHGILKICPLHLDICLLAEPPLSYLLKFISTASDFSSTYTTVHVIAHSFTWTPKLSSMLEASVSMDVPRDITGLHRLHVLHQGCAVAVGTDQDTAIMSESKGLVLSECAVLNNHVKSHQCTCRI